MYVSCVTNNTFFKVSDPSLPARFSYIASSVTRSAVASFVDFFTSTSEVLGKESRPSLVSFFLFSSSLFSPPHQSSYVVLLSLLPL